MKFLRQTHSIKTTMYSLKVNSKLFAQLEPDSGIKKQKPVSNSACE